MQTPLELTIADLGAQGDGIAHHDGKTFFVYGALPGERVLVEIADPDAKQQHLAPVKIISPSPERIAPPCPHFPQCGGCRLQHMDAKASTAWKVRQLEHLMSREGLAACAECPPPLEGGVRGGVCKKHSGNTKNIGEIKEKSSSHTPLTYPPPIGGGTLPLFLPPVTTPLATRRRARLGAKNNKGVVTLGFNVWRSDQLVDLTACAVLTPELRAFLQKLRPELAHWLPSGQTCDLQITSLSQGFDVVLVGGPEPELEEREKLAAIGETLNIAQLSWRQWDRSPIEPIALRQPLHITFGAVDVPFSPASFLQATVTGEKALIDFARNAVGESTRVLDLFCGLGGFGLSCENAKQVCFADLDGPAIASLTKAVKYKSNFSVQERNLIREAYTAHEANAFGAVIFDPPRGGAKAQATHLAHSDVPNVVAISCDVTSFVRDAKILINGGYKLKAILPVDQFLWSTHLELAAHFVR